MYSFALILHSLIRWLVLASVISAAWMSFRGWKGKKRYTTKHNLVRILAVSAVHAQWSLGLILYFTSPITGYFLKNFSEAVHMRDMRFFGMEHITMMIIAVSMITHGSTQAKRKEQDTEKFKAMAIWFTIALVIILLSIPWPFSPFTARPYYRF
jgi:hypothetical protein